ncbi:MAG: phosphoserine phosphatase SerB [Geminicoccaceae bacterium]
MLAVLSLVAAPDALLNAAHLRALALDPAEAGVLSPGRAFELILDAAQAERHWPAWRAALAPERIDVNVVPADARRKRLVLCDMDSTIIQQECLDELADFAGLKAQVAAITQQAMNGEIDFAEALSNRVSLLKDMPVDRLERVWNERISLTPGARTLIQTMTRDGAHAVLVSGGFTFFTQRVARACGFHEHEANVLEVSDGVLTGRVVPPIRASAAKLAKLEALRTRRKLDARATMAIGDGANDLPMLQAAGLGVAYHGHARVNAGCPVQVRHGDLRTALYLQGYGDDEIIEVG